MNTNPFQCIVFNEFEEVMTGLLLLLRSELILNKGMLAPYADTNRPIFKGIEQLIAPTVCRLSNDDWVRLTKRIELTDNVKANNFLELDYSKCVCGSVFKSTFPNVTYYCSFCNDDLTQWITIIQHINTSIWYIKGGSAFRLHSSWFDKWTYTGIQT
jgi:hypothetical protein